jgi:secondary thiamine-phosphate synthase enzyme
MDQISVRTSQRTEFVDITSQLQDFVRKNNIREGYILVFVPHTTGAVTINENADPSVSRDILYELNKVIPFDDRYHHLEGNAAAHIKASLIGSSELIIIENGSLALGTWQGVFFCEFDGPRSRKVWIRAHAY